MIYHAANGLHSLANQPPASTLAAQLVDNISTPAARSSHPVETSELKRLFAVIERIKNQPELAKTPQEKTEHNHILIYVYARVVLEGLQWDDPFAKQAALLTEASKALNFLEVTINETPNVLLHVAEDGAFLFRGREPLWLWLLPRILRMLGSEPCLPLTAAIEHLCCSVIDMTVHLSSLWKVGPQVLLYLQTNVGIIEACLRGHGIFEAGIENGTPLDIQLAPEQVLHILKLDESASPGRCSYSLTSQKQAVRHMTSLVRILKTVVQPRDALPGTVNLHITSPASFENHVVWLLDSLVSLNQILLRCQEDTSNVSSLAALEMCSQLADILPRGNKQGSGVGETLHQKMYNVLTIVCSGVAGAAQEFQGTDSRSSQSRYTLASALAKLAQAATVFKSVSRTIKAQLLWPLKTLTLEHHVVGPESDLWVCCS
jgi:serine/threonine-protein kinase ATR